MTLPCVGLCGWGQRQMCQCGLAMNFKFFCAVGKKLKHEAVGLRCRQVVCPMLVKSLSVCISVSCVNVVLSSFRVAGNVLRVSAYPKGCAYTLLRAGLFFHPFYLTIILLSFTLPLINKRTIYIPLLMLSPNFTSLLNNPSDTSTLDS